MENNFRTRKYSGRGRVLFNVIRRYSGYTLLEIIIVMSIIATISAIGTTQYVGYVQKARVVDATAEIADMSLEITSYGTDNGVYPQSLNDLQLGNRLDLWGRPYQYLNIANAAKKNMGMMRKDRFLVPINSDFDLYSMGKDGKSIPPLNAKDSKDDIIRANDGAYVGLAEGF